MALVANVMVVSSLALEFEVVFSIVALDSGGMDRKVVGELGPELGPRLYPQVLGDRAAATPGEDTVSVGIVGGRLVAGSI